MPPAANTTYKTFILAGERFTIGDHMMIKGTGNRKDSDYIALLERIHTNEEGEVFLDTQWYYRPEETALGRLPWQGVEEILGSNHKDTYHVRCVNSKCKIYSLDEYENLPERPKTKKGNVEYELPVFFCRTFYDREKKKLREELPVYCYCRQPSNPDKPLISCDKCEEWYHGDCVGITPTQADAMKSWSCPTCRGERAPTTAKKKGRATSSYTATPKTTTLATMKAGKAKKVKARKTSKKKK
eukprot:m.34675 g.34675  ORF g.34675 m.34675 type:complete len:242 (-) comp17018_c0_seq1:66-791(-)